MQGKNNIISEITRIHQIMGVNKQISEQVLASTPIVLLKKLADNLVQHAARKSLDKNSRSLISKLSRGTKQITDDAGKIKNTPLNYDDYLNIFGKLRTSPDQGIRNIISAADNVITDIIVKQSFPDVLKDLDVIKKFQGWIQNGVSEDLVVDAMAKVIRDKYGVYADDVIDDLLNNVRKVYKDLGGKVDDVVDDTGKVVDDTGKVVDDTADDTGKVVDDTTNAADDTAKTVEENSEEIVDNLEELKNEDNIAKEILELAPVFTRYQGETLKKWQKLANKIQEHIELANSPELDLTQVDDIDLLIKQDIEKLFDMSKEYVDALEAQVRGGLRTSSGKELEQWQKIDKYLDYIKEKYGDFGAWDVTNSKSELAVWMRSTFEAGFRHLTSPSSLNLIKKGVKALSKAWSEGKPQAEAMETKIEAFAKNIDTDLRAEVKWYEEWLIPGSARGLPKDLETVGKLYKPNAYGEILKYSPKYRKVKAYLSLFGEKMILIGLTQLYYSVIMGVIEIMDFWNSSNKVSLKYRPCVEETSLAIKNGTFDPTVVEGKPKSIPPCLLELLKSKEFVDNELKDFMIRAEFFSHGEGPDLISYYLFKRWEADIYLNPLRYFTGPIGNIMINFYTKWIYQIIDKEKKGEEYAFQSGLAQVPNWIKAQNDNIKNQANSLLDSMTNKEKQELEEAMKILMGADSTEGNSGKVIVPIPEPIK